MKDATAGNPYPRDMIGYGRNNRPTSVWPNGARLALQFVVNYEEGGERSIDHGDGESEAALSDLVGALPLSGMRHVNMESSYDYGSRAGFWRLHRIFSERDIPVTAYAVGMAIEKNPQAAAAMRASRWEVASHGWRWIDYRTVACETERAHIARTVAAISQLAGERPYGHYQGRPSLNTRQLIIEEGGFLYDSESYADDLPYWIGGQAQPHLVIPYALDTNDIRFLEPPCMATAGHFFAYLRNAFDRLYEEGREQPGMMSVGLHGRIVGHPGRAGALCRFLDHVAGRPGAWITRRVDIARHWHSEHAP